MALGVDFVFRFAFWVLIVAAGVQSAPSDLRELSSLAKFRQQHRMTNLSWACSGWLFDLLFVEGEPWTVTCVLLLLYKTGKCIQAARTRRIPSATQGGLGVTLKPRLTRLQGSSSIPHAAVDACQVGASSDVKKWGMCGSQQG